MVRFMRISAACRSICEDVSKATKPGLCIKKISLIYEAFREAARSHAPFRAWSKNGKGCQPVLTGFLSGFSHRSVKDVKTPCQDKRKLDARPKGVVAKGRKDG